MLKHAWHAQAQSFVLDNICYSAWAEADWPVIVPAPPAVPSACADQLLTFDDVSNLGELCAPPSACDQPCWP